jgi:hypothetical protein
LAKAATKHKVPGAWKLRSVILTKGSASSSLNSMAAPGYGLSWEAITSDASAAPQCSEQSCRRGQDLFCQICGFCFCGSHAGRSFAYVGVRCDACSANIEVVLPLDCSDGPGWATLAVTAAHIMTFLDFPETVVHVLREMAPGRAAKANPHLSGSAAAMAESVGLQVPDWTSCFATNSGRLRIQKRSNGKNVLPPGRGRRPAADGI